MPLIQRIPEAAPGPREGYSGPATPSAPLPLPPVIRVPAAGLVQRQPLEVSPVTTIVQRVTGDKEGQEEREKARPQDDLAALAQDIYPLIKRMLAVERERLGGR